MNLSMQTLYITEFFAVLAQCHTVSHSARWRYNPTALDVTTPVYPDSHAYDAVCEGADWVRNHKAPYVDVASLQVWDSRTVHHDAMIQ